MNNNSITAWFGNDFYNLDSLIQNLHVHGCNLYGEINLEYGSGLAGFIGKRIGKKIGMPIKSNIIDCTINISHKNNLLYWDRQFGNKNKISSIFSPIGNYPHGYWIEQTGKIYLELGVEIHDGGWYWIQKKIKFMNITIPAWLAPKSNAYKRVKNGKYEFSVTLSLPLIGKLFSYSGILEQK
jgi:hypothetical protein